MSLRLPDKQPNETIKGLWIDFKNKLLDGETISIGTVTGSASGVVQNVQTSGTQITWDATGGTSGTLVTFSITVTGSMGSVRDATALMVII